MQRSSRFDLYPAGDPPRGLEAEPLEASFRPSVPHNRSVESYWRYDPEQSLLERSSVASGLNSSLSRTPQPLYRTMCSSPKFNETLNKTEDDVSLERLRQDELLRKVSYLERELEVARRSHTPERVVKKTEDLSYENFTLKSKLEQLQQQHEYLSQQLKDKEELVRRSESEAFTRTFEQKQQVNLLEANKQELQARFQEQSNLLAQSQKELAQTSRETAHLEKALATARLEFSEEKQRLEQTLHTLQTEKQAATDSVRRLEDQVKKLADSSAVHKLQERAKTLKELNENLTLELESRPTHRQYKELLHKLEDMQRKPKKYRSVTPSRQLTKFSTRDQMKLDRQLHKQSELKPVKETLELLKINTVQALPAAVKELKQHCSGNKLIKKLTHLVAEFLPSNQAAPSHKQVWKWVRRVLEDVVVLRKQVAKHEEVLSSLKRTFAVTHTEELTSVSHSLAEEHAQLRTVLRRVCEHFKLPANAPLKELEAKLAINEQ